MQVDWWDREAWFIQDHATGTVRGYTDANGEMAKQYRFDAFGNLRSQDTFQLAGSGGLFYGFRNRLGHQGLFAERVDSHTTASIFSANGEVWYQNRSRWYVPDLGRFMTSDPNATGVPVVSKMANYGISPAAGAIGTFLWEPHYGDGWDTYSAYRANPVMNQDPNGLFIAGFMSISGIQNNLRSRNDAASVGAFQHVQNVIVNNMLRYYNVMTGIADGVLIEFSGAGIGAIGGGIALVKGTEKLASNGFLRSFTRGNFRFNLQALSNFTDDVYDLHAHHIIPAEFADDILRITDRSINVNNPIFGQWLDEATHRALHSKGYNAGWETFLKSVDDMNLGGDDAAERILNYARQQASSNGWMIPF